MSLADDMTADLGASAASPAAPSKPRSLADQMTADLPAPAPAGGAPAAVAPDPSAGGGAISIGIPGTRFQFDIPTSQTVDRALSGAGKSIHDMGQGAAQIVRSGLERVGQKATADKLGLTTQADVDETKLRDAPLMNTTAGKVGYVGGSLAATVLPLGVAARSVPLASMLVNPATYGQAAVAGAVNGALQPTGTGDNRWRNMAIGAGTGMIGNGVVNAVGRVAQPVANAVDAARQNAVRVLHGYGVPLDAAQTSGSAFLGRLRSSFSDNPFTAGAQGELIGRQKAAFNNAALGTFGESGPAATQEVMRRADDRIGGVFQDVLNRNNVTVTDPFLSRVAAVQQAANDEEKTAVSNLANRVMASVDGNGEIPGQAAYNVKKDLDRLAGSADSTLAYHARQLRSVLMDGINDSLSGADQQAFAQARTQFRNMKNIEGAIDKEGSGNISPSLLANTLGQKRNRGASIYGRGDQELVQLAQAGKMLLPDKLPNSGTTARAAMQILAPLGASAAGGAYDASQGDYGSAAGKALMAGAAAIAAPRAAQFLINNPATARYLTGGVQSMPLRSLLQAPQQIPMFGGAVRRLPNDVRDAGPAP